MTLQAGNIISESKTDNFNGSVNIPVTSHLVSTLVQVVVKVEGEGWGGVGHVRGRSRSGQGNVFG